MAVLMSYMFWNSWYFAMIFRLLFCSFEGKRKKNSLLNDFYKQKQRYKFGFMYFCLCYSLLACHDFYMQTHLLAPTCVVVKSNECAHSYGIKRNLTQMYASSLLWPSLNEDRIRKKGEEEEMANKMKIIRIAYGYLSFSFLICSMC